MITNNADTLRAAAQGAMLANGFEPDFPAEALAEAARAVAPVASDRSVRDLRALPWSSIDNDSSRDLDQLEVAEEMDGGNIRVRVAIADVSATVAIGSAIDRHAATNATSVYAGVETFSMLPERLSTSLTSLGAGNDRPAVVIEFVVDVNGAITAHDVYLAYVNNHAKLAYISVGAWLDGTGALPAVANEAIEAQLRVQNVAAERLRKERARRGALSFETIEAQSVLRADGTVDVELVQKTRASHLIEDFMVAANIVMAQFLDERHTASIRRVVRTPERWPRIVALAKEVGGVLPAEPDASALEAFLAKRQAVDPARYADLSLSIVKLLGPGAIRIARARCDRGGTLRIGHAVLHAFDGAESAICRSRHAAFVEGSVTRRIVTLHVAAVVRHCGALHGARERRAQGGAAGAQGGSSCNDGTTGGGDIRRGRDGRDIERDIRARDSAAGGGAGGSRGGGDGCGGAGAGPVGRNGHGAGGTSILLGYSWDSVGDGRRATLHLRA